MSKSFPVTQTRLGRPYTPTKFDATRRAQFARDRWRHLAAHLGHEPSYAERIIVSRCIAIEWELLRLDARLDAGEALSGHAIRGRLAAEDRLRRDLQTLGIKGGGANAQRGPTLDDALAAGREAAEAAGL